MEQVITKDLRNELKQALQKELNNLPDILEQLEPKERLNMVCKLMPYVFPKVHSTYMNDGEPLDFNPFR